MPTYGPNSPASGANIAGANTDWSNPGNVVSSNNTRATAALSNGSHSDYLAATNYSFSIPGSDTIVGIEVSIEANRTGDVNISGVAVTKDGSSLIGSTNPNQALSGTDTAYTYGGASDLWGDTWTPAEINASTFGALVRCLGRPFAGGTAQIDHITITVYTTAGNPWHAYAQQ